MAWLNDFTAITARPLLLSIAPCEAAVGPIWIAAQISVAASPSACDKNARLDVEEYPRLEKSARDRAS